MTCKVFTQNDIKTNYVFLTEDQAKANIKELIAYDALQLISTKQEERILNFKSTIAKYETVVINKDSIITYKDSIIGVQEKIIKYKKKVEFHTYAGVETFNLNFDQLSGYFRAAIEFKKINIGAKINYRPVQIYDMPDLYYNLHVEYKLF